MENYKKNLELLTKNHVYSKEMEHDACGVGLIASTEGKKSRAIVEYGIEALKAVWHRGAVDADGKTGDGAGIHVEIPKDFFIEKIQVTGHDYDNSEICVGMIFLPRNDYSAQESCKTIVESELTKNNFSIYGWRQVPVNSKVLGEKALQTMPEIIQVLFKPNDPNLLDKNLERKIYETRKRIENKAFDASLNNFYICSISSKSIIYKGLYLAESLSDFYLDLRDSRFISRYAIFHQRFSTNTAPSWSLAQPFRAIAHNGEINTYKGNKNWMKVHEQEMSSPLFEDIENLKPVIQKGVSDSAALDNVFELLNKSGQSAPLAKLMLVPDAWSKKNKTLSKSHQQLFNFLNSTMEPWDGPAAIAATDNEWVIAANDRNGLRPLRYAITKDKMIFAGSETGMIDLNEKKILTKGRLGPGEIIGVRIEKGKVFSNSQIKDYLAKEFKHFNSQIIDLDEKLSISNDQSSITLNQVSDLVNNIIFGVILVVIVLMFFLGFRNALFVGFAIPMSMFMSFMILSFMGYTMNTMVLFGLVMGLGMLVDNGIVVVENVYRLMEKEGMDRVDAAKAGIGEIASPIIVSTATTIAAFVPLGAWPGLMGEFMNYFPITLSVVLGSSLIVALFFNSMLVSRFMEIDEHEISKKSLYRVSLILGGLGVLLLFNSGVIRGLGTLMICITLLLWVYKYFIKKLASQFKMIFLPSLEKAYSNFLSKALKGYRPIGFLTGTFLLLFSSLLW